METFVGLILFTILIVIQSSLLVHLNILSYMPELLLIFCVYMGARLNWYRGFWWGILCGIGVSAFSVIDLRFAIAVFALSGLIAGSFRGTLFVDSIGIKVILLFFISLLQAILFGVFYKEISLSFFSFNPANKYLFKIPFINCVFAIPLYYIMEKVFTKLSPYEKS
ncbi:MAG: rod shape-determining protein MreD [Candidatus Aureabacteria bacterium]|nr:rod shape-determining protein MreD [Candidatus Auribacterota bacterium]